MERMKALTDHIQPMVAQALVTAFQRSLREELGEAAAEDGRTAPPG